MHAYSVTLKLDNQKNGWKGVFVQKHENGEKSFMGFVSKGVSTVTSVKLQAEIGQ